MESKIFQFQITYQLKILSSSIISVIIFLIWKSASFTMLLGLLFFCLLPFFFCFLYLINFAYCIISDVSPPLDLMASYVQNSTTKKFSLRFAIRISLLTEKQALQKHCHETASPALPLTTHF